MNISTGTQSPRVQRRNGMSDRSARRVAIGVWLASVLLTVGTLPFLVASHRVAPVGVIGSIGAVVGLLWVSLGARIAMVRHGNAVGWLFCNVGLGIALTQFAAVYTVYGLRVNRAHQERASLRSSANTG